MHSWINWFVASYILVFFLLVFVWRTYRIWKQTGINGYTLNAKTGVERITAGWFRVMPLLTLSVAIIYIGLPKYYDRLGILHGFERDGVRYTGVFLMLAALVWIVAAQIQMGRSWRIGIDHDNETGLVDSGIFALSRNPIFVGIWISAIGYFLLLPNAVTLLIVAIDAVLIQVQVALEEEFLHRRHGDRYDQYCRRVRRWM